MAAVLNFGSYSVDSYSTENGKQLSFVFFGHASIAVTYDQKVIYVDPVSSEADYATLPKADVILVTHAHEDHLDKESIEVLSTPATLVIANAAAADELQGASVMKNGDTKRVGDWLQVEAVAAYNTTPSRGQFHPKGRDNGYILTIAGERIYVAGDSEPTPEMATIRNIDYLFLAVNQPYTMTPAQAASVVNELHPKVFYPYHYGQTEEKTDLKRLARLITANATKMKIRDME